MTGEILDAIIKESQAIPDFQVGTVILKTDFKLDKIDSYSMPLLLIDFTEAGESGQLIGGLTRMDWDIGFNSYNYEPDTLGDDTTGYSTGLLNVIDTVRTHFTRGRTYGWLTQGMTDILNNYGFRFTLSGITAAEPLEGDGLVMGYRVGMSSVSFDNSTVTNPPSSATLNAVTQVGNPPY